MTGPETRRPQVDNPDATRVNGSQIYMSSWLRLGDGRKGLVGEPA